MCIRVTSIARWPMPFLRSRRRAICGRKQLPISMSRAVLDTVAEVLDRAHGEALLTALRAHGLDAVPKPRWVRIGRAAIWRSPPMSTAFIAFYAGKLTRVTRKIDAFASHLSRCRRLIGSPRAAIE